MRLLEEDPEKALEKTVENLVANKYFKDETGMWKVFDEQTQQWKDQKEEPKEEIENFRKQLMEGMQGELFEGTGKNQKKSLKGLSAEQIKKIEKNRKKSKR